VYSIAVATRTETPGCVLRVVTEDGTDCVEVQNGANTHLTCEHLTLKIRGHKSLKVTVSGKQVAVSGPTLNASADEIAFNGQSHLVLKGHGQLSMHPDQGECARVVASQISLDLTDGKIECRMVGTERISTPHSPAPLGATANELFNFWTGSMR
jgi:hypothetical protein